MERCSLQETLSLAAHLKGARCQIHTKFSDLGPDSAETFKSKIPTKLMVIKFKNLFAFQFPYTLKLYVHTLRCPSLSRIE